MMLAHWRPDGHTVPNAGVYPWQWLWDSCFHALIWAELGEPERAVTELRSALADQDELGFVPHIRYAGAPSPMPSSGAARPRRRSPSRRCTATRSPSWSGGGSPCPATSASGRCGACGSCSTIAAARPADW